MQDEQEHRFYLTYLALFLLCWVLAGISAIFANNNPVGWTLITLTSPLVPLTGGDPAYLSSNPGLIRVIVNLFWPLTLVPLHLVTTKGFKWRLWQYLLLLIGFNLVLAFGIQRVDLGM